MWGRAGVGGRPSAILVLATAIAACTEDPPGPPAGSLDAVREASAAPVVARTDDVTGTVRTLMGRVPTTGGSAEERARGFLDAYGARCHCDACGEDILVAYSCKSRGVCPSCGARRMANLAAQMVDRVLPNVPIRQWVLSLPFELRGLCAKKPEVLTAMGRIFYETVVTEQKARLGLAGSETGAVSFPQRFGSSLNAHVHFHTLVLDGAVVREGQGVCFQEAPPPSREQLEDVARRVRDRAVRFLQRRGYLDERCAEDRGNERSTPAPIDACLQLALAGGTLLSRPTEAALADGDAQDFERTERRFWASCDDFDIECGARVGRDEDERRECLVRYCARPPLCLDRIELLPDGRDAAESPTGGIAYRLKTPRKGRTHRVMTPLEFMARLSALVPPPRYPLVRYHGVLGPRSRWRSLVVPRSRRAANRKLACSLPGPGAPDQPAFESRTTAPVARVPPARLSGERPAAPSYPVPNVITVRHWDRLLDGELYATEPRVDWARLMRRTFRFDVTVCPNCSGRMRVLSAISDTAVTKRILDHLGVPSDVPEAAPARDPTWEQLSWDQSTSDSLA